MNTCLLSSYIIQANSPRRYWVKFRPWWRYSAMAISESEREVKG